MTEWRVQIIPAAERELRRLPADLQGRYLHIAEMIEAFGPHEVGQPHVKPLGGKLWEMRLRGRDGIARAIYFAASGRQLVVVRVFAKKTQKIPRQELALAEARMKEFLDDER